ncbi:hypothetical protein ACWOCJ_09825 [Enterococcus pseudoavium]|uniref:hypothetical protein n=1 Tax=Enterococcus pseudoavium TaxID=44007 RepID=UPI000835E780|nr:hypothetical protein [Enterococcus pseudoavium]
MKKIFDNSTFQSLALGSLAGGIVGLLIIFLFGVRFSIDGSLAEWLSAIGTIGAVVVSLWLVFRKEKLNVRILVRNGNKQERTEDGIIMINTEKSMVVVSAYNAGEITAGVSFMGFRSKKLAQEPNEEGYILDLFDVVKGSSLEFIPPGNSGKEHILTSDLLLGIGDKYKEHNGEIILDAVFIDIKGKEIIQSIIVPKDWE